MPSPSLIGGTLAHAEPQRREHFRSAGELGDRDGGRLRLAVAIESQRDLGADIQAGGQVSQPGRVGDFVVGQLDDHVVRLEPGSLGRAAGLHVDDQSAPVARAGSACEPPVVSSGWMLTPR